MNKSTNAIIMVILVVGIFGIGAISNPQKGDYVDYTVSQFVGLADPGLIKAVMVSALEPIVDTSTRRSDYVVFSVYDFSIPGYSSQTLGLFGNFILMKENNSFKDAVQGIMQSGTIDGVQVMDVVNDVVNDAVQAVDEALSKPLIQPRSDIINGYSVMDLRNRLQMNGSTESISEAYWVIEQGDAILPAIDQLLSEPVPADATGAYPFNMMFALSQFNGPAVKDVLKKHDGQLALKAVEAREVNPAYRVIYSECSLLQSQFYTSPIITQIPEGETVLLLQERVENPNEEGPMGGSSFYDYVQIVSTGQTGFTARSGGGYGFPAFW